MILNFVTKSRLDEVFKDEGETQQVVETLLNTFTKITLLKF